MYLQMKVIYLHNIITRQSAINPNMIHNVKWLYRIILWLFHVFEVYISRYLFNKMNRKSTITQVSMI